MHFGQNYELQSDFTLDKAASGWRVILTHRPLAATPTQLSHEHEKIPVYLWTHPYILFGSPVKALGEVNILFNRVIQPARICPDHMWCTIFINGNPHVIAKEASLHRIVGR